MRALFNGVLVYKRPGGKQQQQHRSYGVRIKVGTARRPGPWQDGHVSKGGKHLEGLLVTSPIPLEALASSCSYTQRLVVTFGRWDRVHDDATRLFPLPLELHPLRCGYQTLPLPHV